MAAVCLLLTTGLQAQAPLEKEAPDILRQLSDSFEALAKRVSPSVVQVLVTGFGPVEEGEGTNTALIAKQHITGSGVIVDARGYIITNAHVVEAAQRVRVIIPSRTASGSPRSMTKPPAPAIDARIIGLDKDIDLALLKVEAEGLPALPLGSYAALRKGQVVLAFGSPEGLENSVTMGVVSSVARQPDPDRPMVYIQTDAPINPGNSGIIVRPDGSYQVTYHGRPLYLYIGDAYIPGIPGISGQASINGAGVTTPWGVFNTIPPLP